MPHTHQSKFGIGRRHGLAGLKAYHWRDEKPYDSTLDHDAYMMGYAKGVRERQLAHEGHSFDLFTINGIFTPTTILTRKPRT